jgi:hypothetical protein
MHFDVMFKFWNNILRQRIIKTAMVEHFKNTTSVIAFLDMNRSIDLHLSRFDMTFSQGNGHIELLFYCYSDLSQLNCSKINSYNSNEYSYMNGTLVMDK